MCLAAVDNFEACLVVQPNSQVHKRGLTAAASAAAVDAAVTTTVIVWCVPAAAAAARSAAAAAKGAAAAEANRRCHALLLLVFARGLRAERQRANVVLDAVPRKIRRAATGGRREAGGLQQREMHVVLACSHVQRR